MAAAPISNKDDDVTQSSFFIRLSASENERDAKNYSSRQRNGKLSDAITAFFIRDHYKVSTLFDSIRIKSILSMCPFSFLQTSVRAPLQREHLNLFCSFR